MEDYPFHAADAPHTANYLWPSVVALLGGPQQAVRRVADLGAGNGAFAAHPAARGFRVTAIEPSSSGVAVLRGAHPAIETIQASAYDDLSPQHATFDAAVALEVVEQCYYPRRLVATLGALVPPGGLVVLSTPYHGYAKNLAIALLGGWDRHFTALWDHGHIKVWSVRTLSALVAGSGLVVASVVRVGRLPPFAESMILCARKPDGAERDRT